MIRFAVHGRSWRTLCSRAAPKRWREEGWRAVGREKSVWATKISPLDGCGEERIPQFPVLSGEVAGVDLRIDLTPYSGD